MGDSWPSSPIHSGAGVGQRMGCSSSLGMRPVRDWPVVFLNAGQKNGIRSNGSDAFTFAAGEDVPGRAGYWGGGGKLLRG